MVPDRPGRHPSVVRLCVCMCVYILAKCHPRILLHSVPVRLKPEVEKQQQLSDPGRRGMWSTPSLFLYLGTCCFVCGEIGAGAWILCFHASQPPPSLWLHVWAAATLPRIYNIHTPRGRLQLHLLNCSGWGGGAVRWTSEATVRLLVTWRESWEDGFVGRWRRLCSRSCRMETGFFVSRRTSATVSLRSCGSKQEHFISACVIVDFEIAFDLIQTLMDKYKKFDLYSSAACTFKLQGHQSD